MPDRSLPAGSTDILATGFGTSVATWTVGYVCRLPAVEAPSALVLFLVVLCFLGGGWVAGRLGARGTPGGLYAGLLAGVINLLVLGSLLGGEAPNEIVPSALLWVPGSILLTAGLGAAGAALGVRGREPLAPSPDWTSAFARVAAAATFLLVVVGGLVTSARAGLAVVDWPNSFGYSMFLYPLSRMTGGIYYEHAHRLFGSLVGLTTLTLAVLLQAVEPRRAVRAAAWGAVVMVVVQGILGGLRVTGRFTLSADPAQTSPSLVLAVLHGTLGQVFLSTMVALAAVLSPAWKAEEPPSRSRAAASERRLGAALVVLLLVQLVLGAIQRHLDHGLAVHLATAALIVPLAAAAGFRAWGPVDGNAVRRRTGITILAVVGVQVILGISTYAAIGAVENGLLPPVFRLALATAHQATGALLLACAVLLALWNYRLLEPEV